MPTTKKAIAKKSPKKKKTGLVIHKPVVLSLANPQHIIESSLILKKFVADNKLSIKIRGEDYCLVDGWKFLGYNFGITAVPTQPQARHLKGEYVTTLFAMRQYFDAKGKPTYKKESPVFVGYADNKEILDGQRKRNQVTREHTRPHFSYECEAVVQNILTGAFITRGSGACSNIEMKKAEFSEHQVKSMTETRSISKAFRNLLGHVMKASGYSSTPAEEMEFDDDEYINAEHTSEDEADIHTMDEKQYRTAYDKIRFGEMTVEHVMKGYPNLDPEQKKSLEVAEKQFQKKKS